jgi:LemA protein
MGTEAGHPWSSSGKEPLLLLDSASDRRKDFEQTARIDLPARLDFSRRFTLNRIMTISLLVLAGLLLAIVWVIVLFNGLIGLRNTADNAWSDVDVHLKKRHDLVPNLVEVVKGYAKHERETLERVVEARRAAVGAASTEARISAENSLTRGLERLFALSESYPDLKANQGFLQLQHDLSDVEDDIANARRYYNAVVRDFNTKQQLFPANLIAGALGFQGRPFFQAESSEREPVRVQV